MSVYDLPFGIGCFKNDGRRGLLVSVMTSDGGLLRGVSERNALSLLWQRLAADKVVERQPIVQLWEALLLRSWWRSGSREGTRA